MATYTIRLPRLTVGWKEQPQLFERYWDEVMTSLETSLNAILAIPAIEAALAAVTTTANAAIPKSLATGAGLFLRSTAANTWAAIDAAATKVFLALENVNNTSDADKPVSTAQATALALKAPLASPALTGNPTAPTPTAGDNDTSLATTAFVTTAVSALGLASAAWTPTIQSAGTDPTVTYSVQEGRYTRIGDHVSCWFAVAFTCSAEGTSALELAGLPLTGSSALSWCGGVDIDYQTGFDTSIDGGYVMPGQTYARLTSRSGATLDNTSVTALATAGTNYLVGRVSYWV